MKLNNNQKIILGLAIGGGLAWFFLSRKTKPNQKSDVSNENDMTHLAKTREEKIEYILNNLEANNSELMSGFSGDRFEFDPTIGYAIPIGTVRETEAGNEMIISRNGNFANEIYFNADGEETDNPVEEAVALLDGLSDLELNVVYACVLAKKENPNVQVSEVIAEMPADANSKNQLTQFLNKRMNDIKSIKKSPRWTSFWKKRREDGRKWRNMFRNKTKSSSFEGRFSSKGRLNQNEVGRGNLSSKGRLGLSDVGRGSNVGRTSFKNQVINRNV